jgi:hypothetical protein
MIAQGDSGFAESVYDMIVRSYQSITNNEAAAYTGSTARTRNFDVNNC